MNTEKINAEVVAVYPNKVKISVDKLEDFKIADESLRVGSYLRISDNDDSKLFAIIENFSIEVRDDGNRKYQIEANTLGILRKGEFIRGGNSVAIPPKRVEPASEEEIRLIYEQPIEDSNKFIFSSLSSNRKIRIPVDGNKFFNKHIAVVGATGSGKSHTIATILQNTVSEKSGTFNLNNSHIIIFDIHSEYQSAFPKANHINIKNLVLPYWLLNGEELEEMFLDTESNDHNQRFVFRESVIESRKSHFKGADTEKANIHFDSPLFFDIEEVFKSAVEKNIEVIDSGELYASGAKKGQPKTTQGSLHGRLTNFINRLEGKINNKKLQFILGEKSKKITFDETLTQLLGYKKGEEANVTIIDLSGIPFDVLSITVSLISRILFEYGYFYKRIRNAKDSTEKINNDIPLLLVYEEAHKYVPNSELSKYRSSKKSIERIAKEGRKYGITLLLASQRPAEISETIFSQCNTFIAMRLTNPNDQSYVKKLLPDMLGNMVDTMPSLKAGEALLIGESIVLPSIVQIDQCITPPSSHDIPYWEIWKEEWKELNIESIRKEWLK